MTILALLAVFSSKVLKKREIVKLLRCFTRRNLEELRALHGIAERVALLLILRANRDLLCGSLVFTLLNGFLVTQLGSSVELSSMGNSKNFRANLGPRLLPHHVMSHLKSLTCPPIDPKVV